MLKPRRIRRQEAREQGVPFEPVYSEGTRNGKKVGGEPKTYEEMFGEGYERFDDKFTKVSELIDD